MATSTVLIRKDAFEKAGGFDESFRGPEDYDLWLRVASKYRIMKMDAPLTRYRHVPGSLSMDERKFLPQVLRVLEKAFGAGGALEQYAERRQEAVSNQQWNASWMAFQRGRRGRAIGLLLSAYVLNRRSKQPVSRPWARLLFRYLVGKREIFCHGHTRT